MLNKQHNINYLAQATGEETQGSCLQGCLENVSFQELVFAFGSPWYIDSKDNKTDVEWSLKCDDGLVFTIYNWKNGPNYLKEKGLPIDQITTWNVGGFTKEAYMKVQEILDSHTEEESTPLTIEFDDLIRWGINDAYQVLETILTHQCQACSMDNEKDRQKVLNEFRKELCKVFEVEE